LPVAIVQRVQHFVKTAGRANTSITKLKNLTVVTIALKPELTNRRVWTACPKICGLAMGDSREVDAVAVVIL
jgi:hypothetical protein